MSGKKCGSWPTLRAAVVKRSITKPRAHQPLQLTTYVKSLHDGQLWMRALFKGMSPQLGSRARMVDNGTDIIVASKRSQTFAIDPLPALGIDVTE